MKWYLWWKTIDKLILVVTGALVLIGALLINVSTQSVALRIGIDYYSFINKQLIFLFGGGVLILICSTLNTKQLEKFSILGFIIFFILLIAVKFLGYETKGARRWINLIGVSIQPSEFIKPFFCVCNALILSGKRFEFMGMTKSVEPHKRIIISGALYICVAVLLILQPDFGMFLVVTFLWLTQLFIAGLSYTLVIGGISMATCAGIMAYIFLDHVRSRVEGFLGSYLSAKKQGYQVSKSLSAFRNGGLFGVGLGDGSVKRSLPDSHTDFIFAVAGEEFGGFFCILLLTLFVVLILRVIAFCMKLKDSFVLLSLIGLISQIGIQVLVNVGVSLNLLPTKGMTLPLISYGGSSTLAVSILFGFILALNKNIVTHRYKIILT